jgi:glycosyltransferase involved in cell wall biosynthesis
VIMKVSVVIPSLNRPERLKKTIVSLLSTSPEVEIIAVLSSDDLESHAVVKSFEVVRIIDQDDAHSAVEAWNMGAAAANGDCLVLGADDLRFCDGWLDAATESLAQINNYGLVAFNDLSPMAGELATHYMVTRNYAVNEWGGVLAIPTYKQQWLDNEATTRAVRDQCFVYAEDAVVEHLHPIWKKADNDTTYNRAIEGNWYAHGETIFKAREQSGFKNDYEPSFSMRVPDCQGWGAVSVGARSHKYPEPSFVSSLAKMLIGGMRKGDNVFDIVHGYPGHVAANNIVRTFLNTRSNSLLMIDDDMAFDANALEVLRSNKANWDYDVVMGFCTHKTIPPHAVVMKLHEEQPGPPLSLMGEHFGTLRDVINNSVMDVDAVGLAFTLIKRHVLESMVSEYGAIYTSWFDWGQHSEGEDIVFSRKCRERGYSLAVDTNVKIGHVGRYTFGWSDFKSWTSQEN